MKLTRMMPLAALLTLICSCSAGLYRSESTLALVDFVSESTRGIDAILERMSSQEDYDEALRAVEELETAVRANRIRSSELEAALRRYRSVLASWPGVR